MPCKFIVPDFIKHELRNPPFQTLSTMGLLVETLDSEMILEITQIMERFEKPSYVDISALVLARFRRTILITGDEDLRHAAMEYGVDSLGTCWLIDYLAEQSIITHTEAATVGPAQQELFLRFGANPERVMIGHQNKSEVLEYALSQLEKPGFYLGFDRVNPLMSTASEDNAVSLVVRGYGNRIMLSHDCIFVWLGRPGNLPARYADWYPDFLFKKLLPKMKAAGVTDEQIRGILVDNPRRFFGGM